MAKGIFLNKGVLGSLGSDLKGSLKGSLKFSLPGSSKGSRV